MFSGSKIGTGMGGKSRGNNGDMFSAAAGGLAVDESVTLPVKFRLWPASADLFSILKLLGPIPLTAFRACSMIELLPTICGRGAIKSDAFWTAMVVLSFLLMAGIDEFPVTGGDVVMTVLL